MGDVAGWAEDWSRRQFLLRGGAAVGTVSLWGLASARAARGDVPGQLSAAEVAVLEGLVSAVMVAVGATGNPADLGLQAPEAIVTGFASSPTLMQAYIVTVLDAIDSAPSSGTFASLSDSARQAFMRASLAPFKPLPPTAAQLGALAQVTQLLAAEDAAITAQLASGTPPGQGVQPPAASVSPPAPGPVQTFPATPPPPASLVFAQTLIAGLELVSTPFVLPPPPLPLPPPVSLDVVLALVEFVLTALPGTAIPQELIAQLQAAADTEVDELPPPPAPAPVLSDALAVWILGA